MTHRPIALQRLVDYALRLGVGAVVRRLGYLLEHYGMADVGVMEPLRAKLTATYQRLDPLPMYPVSPVSPISMRIWHLLGLRGWNRCAERVPDR